MYTISRYILGILLLIFGFNVFLQFAPGPEFNAAGSAFLGALMATGYIFPLIGLAKIFFGLSLLLNRHVALFAVMFVPFTVNIVLFHTALDSAGIVSSFVLMILHIIVIRRHMDKYRAFICSDRD
jgi:putative oxidoreductase